MIKNKTYRDDYGTLGFPPKGIKLQEFMIIDDKVHQIRKVVVHSFAMGDVEDPDLYAAEPLYKWQKSEMGQWVMEHSLETPIWNRFPDSHTYGYRYTITAHLKGEDYTFWSLKWGG